MEHNTLKGVIFDLDGTLLDSMGVWYEVDRIFLTRHGVKPPEGISEIVKKMTIDEASNYFIEQFSLPMTSKEVANEIESIVTEKYEHELPLKPYVKEVLDKLDEKGIPYGVATATYPTLAVKALERLGVLSKLKFLITEKDAGSGKTSPDIYYMSAKKLGLGKRQIVVVEDTLHSIQTASKAGFFTVGVYDKLVKPEDWKEIQATATITMKDLRNLISIF